MGSFGGLHPMELLNGDTHNITVLGQGELWNEVIWVNIRTVKIVSTGEREKVKFEWMITTWSECSQTCGEGLGIKVTKHHFDAFLYLDEKENLQIIDSKCSMHGSR